MNIGEAAKLSGVSSKMIRHYESIGLLAGALRNASGYRVYGENDLHTLRFIGTARSLGFSLDEIKQLLSLWQDKNRSSADVKNLVLNHIADLDQKIAELTSLRSTLQTLAGACSGSARPECPILSGISAHCIVHERT
jgi:MerR family copper efflux transcriptional regulator